MTTRAAAEALDRYDPLAERLSAFDRPPGIYLDGHSLGPPTKAARARIARASEEWARGLVGAWNAAAEDYGWIDLPARAGGRIARLLGAAPEEVAVADSVSVDLFKLAGALLRPGRALAVVEGEFPTDGYVLAGLAGLTGAPLLRLAPGAPAGGRGIGVLVRSLVDYRSAAVADMAAEERAAAAADVSIVWDLSHATGLLALDLPRDGARYAVGCGYKYLGGGPGAPAFLFVRSDAAGALANPVAGWFGHAAPFDFAGDYAPAAGARRFLAGTPPVLSLSALDAALELFDGIATSAIEAKAQALCGIFRGRLADAGVNAEEVAGRRGGHVAVRRADGGAIVSALIERGVQGDFRPPDLMRFGFSPLFLKHVDAFDAAEALVDVVRTGAHRAPRHRVRRRVT